jgi:putative serine protease PepD
MSTAPPPPRPSWTRVSRTQVIAALLVGAILASAILGAFGLIGRSHSTSSASAAVAPSATALNPTALYRSDAAGVVDITATGATADTAVLSPFGGAAPGTPVTDTGTGFVVDHARDIVTADHVVSGAKKVTVTLQDGKTYNAKVLGQDASSDLAVLKASAPGSELKPLKLGNSAGMDVGNSVAAIGDPFALDRSMSTGIVSGVDRTIQAPSGFSLTHIIQTDAALNPGNSGGPVLNASGAVIGIADQIATNGAEQNTGVGFVIPSDVVRAELTALEHGQQVAHAYLGIATAPATGSQPGVLVPSVVSGGPSAQAGLKAGDVITKFDGTPITTANGLISVMANHKPGDHVTMVVRRGSATKTLTVVLGHQPTKAASIAG